MISLNIRIDKSLYRFNLETEILACFQSKSLKHTAIIFFSNRRSPKLAIVKLTTSTRTDITLETTVIILRASRMFSAFLPDCWHDKSKISLLGTCIFRIQCFRLYFACTTRHSSFSAEATPNVLNASPYVKCASFPLKNKRIISYSLKVDRGIFFLNRRKSKFKELLELCMVLEGIAQDKSVFVSIHGMKTMKIVTNVCNAKRAATF